MFTIVTPTYKRSELLKRAISSVQSQTCQDYIMIIINDSPLDESYESIKSICAHDAKIAYLINETNQGVNFSRNRGLSLADSGSWIIFLDDDDYLAPNALAHFKALIDKHPNQKWFMSNRALPDGTSLTYAPYSNTLYSYTWDYLLAKNITGDATHCIQKKYLASTRFSKKVKQGEEWLFFYQLGLKGKFFYSNHNSTLSDGYDASSGLNFRNRPKSERFNSLMSLCKEGLTLGFGYHPSFLFYVYARFLILLLK